MNCHEFEERMHTLLDDRQQPVRDSLLLAHADNCDRCGLMLSACHDLFAGLAGCQGLPGPVSLRDSAASTTHRTAWHWALPLATAALVLIAITPWVVTRVPAPGDVPVARGQDGKQPAIDLVAVSTDPSAPELEVTALAEVEIGGSDLSSEQYLDLARATGELAEELAAERLSWVGPVADGLWPVTTSVSAAFSALRRTVPGGTPPSSAEQVSPGQPQTGAV